MEDKEVMEVEPIETTADTGTTADTKEVAEESGAALKNSGIVEEKEMMEEEPNDPTVQNKVSETDGTKQTKGLRGMPKSGRWWKETQSARYSALVKVKPLKSSWEKKMADRAKQKQVRLLQQEIRDRKAQERQEKIERRKEQEKRRLENERKGEVVQVIKNTAKLRKAKKKQLRFIEKRDTN
ncbi:unnamed protein product [Cylicocyclus nassatus]|uniref:Coiled-coil domain-containing protein 86 n=1 Tax=Cylicocyclus nassatus TaxID=53992 RepID=A0AA36GLU5_CYLNA|nr:unnamed protein product [Cylicocyclus nassatus]